VGRTTTYVRATRLQNNLNDYGQVFVDTVITPFTTQITYPDGRQDHFTYDFSGARILLTQQQLAGRGVENYAYQNTAMTDSALLVDSIWGPGTRTQRFFYSTYAANGLPDSVLARTTLSEDPLVETEEVTRYMYDSTHHKPLTVTDGVGTVTTYTYDGTFGNQATLTMPGHGTVSTTFDSHGRDSLLYTPMHAPVRTTYDVMDRVVTTSVLTGTPVTTTTTYDALFATGVTDAKSQRYVIEHDALGRVTRECPANDSTTCRTFRYDRGGRLTSITNRRGQTVQMTYDGIGRMVTRTGTGLTDSLAYSETVYETRTMAWNSVARDSLFNTYIDTAISGTTDITRFATDATKYFRTLHSVIDEWTGDDSITVATNTGNTFAVVTYGKVPNVPGARSITVDSVTDYPLLDQKQRLTEVTTGRTSGTSVYTLSGYTTGDRPARLAFATPGVDSVFERAYAYDSVSRVQAIQQVRGHLQRQFSYDSLGRLSAVAYRNQPCQTWPGTPDTDFGWRDTCVGTADSVQTFTYDAVGNRTDHGGTYTAGNRITHFGPWTFTYDADGNVTQKQDTTTGETWHYTWDPLNRLVGVAQAGGDSLTYEYDALGRLARRKTNGTIDRHWLYVGAQIMAELDGGLQEQVQYSYNPGIDRPHTADGLRLIQDELGNVIGDQDYTPWGRPISYGTSDSKLLWKGLLYERDTDGLYYMRNRWYDPDIGRFLAEDPAGLQAGVNFYTFAGNDPINGFDPNGRGCPPLCDHFDPKKDHFIYTDNPYVAGTSAAVLLVFSGGLFLIPETAEASAVLEGAFSVIEDVTSKGARMINRAINVSRAEFEDNLVKAGFKKTRDNVIREFTNGDIRYVTRSFSTSTGEPTAEVWKGGNLIMKIRIPTVRLPVP
jgi:RHS repeat-associated protein